MFYGVERKDANDFIEMTNEEKVEFFEISKKLNHVLQTLWQPDRMNYASLANRTKSFTCSFCSKI